MSTEAERLAAVSGPGSQAAWEDYSRKTFHAHVRNVPADKFRYLQYIDEPSAEWWAEQRKNGAVLLGKPAKELGLTFTAPPLTKDERKYLKDREKVVTIGVRASIAAARALYEIHRYEGGRLWNREFPTFEAYCRARWEYGKSHSYRLVECGEFVTDLEREAESFQSPNGDWLPKNEGQIRPVLALPKEHRVNCWKEIVAETVPGELTSRIVSRKTKQHMETNGLVVLRRPSKNSGKIGPAAKLLEKLRAFAFGHTNGHEIANLLDQVEALID